MNDVDPAGVRMRDAGESGGGAPNAQNTRQRASVGLPVARHHGCHRRTAGAVGLLLLVGDID